jgi:hypothetical protein
MSLLKTKNDKNTRIFVVMTLLVVLINIIYALVINFIDYHAVGQIFWGIFCFSLLFLGYFLWKGQDFAAVLLAIIFSAYGLLCLFGAIMGGSFILAILAFLTISGAVSSILSLILRHRNLNKK